jgi:hypothetical protein
VHDPVFNRPLNHLFNHPCRQHPDLRTNPPHALPCSHPYNLHGSRLLGLRVNRRVNHLVYLLFNQPLLPVLVPPPSPPRNQVLRRRCNPLLHLPCSQLLYQVRRPRRGLQTNQPISLLINPRIFRHRNPLDLHH